MFTIIKQIFIYTLITVILLFIPVETALAETTKMNAKEITISVGTSAKLSMNSKQKVQWSSLDETIATVSNRGKVTAINSGKTVIKAEIKNRYYKCIVTVDTPLLSVNSLEMKTGEKSLLKVTGTERRISWESTNPNVVYIDNGEVIAINKGKADIIAKIGKDKKLVCEVTIKDKKEETSSIYLNETNLILDKVNQRKQLIADIYPAEARHSEVLMWFSSDNSIVNVDQSGCITALKEGQVVINVFTSNGKRAQCNVRVVLKQPVTFIYLNKTELNFNKLSEQTNLMIITNTGNIMFESISWRSSNEEVATVDNSGLVKPVSNGKCIINAETKNGKRVECLVNVELEMEAETLEVSTEVPVFPEVQ